MKTTVWMAALAVVSMSSPASAWTSTFFDRTNGGSFTQTGEATAADAQRVAFQKCQAKAKNADCVEVGSPKSGTAVVIALGTKNSANDNIFRIADPDPDKAAQQVLNDCRKVAKDCHLSLAAWDAEERWASIALDNAGTVFVSYNAATREHAKADALRGCEKNTSRKGACEALPDLTISLRSWFAFARGGTHEGFGASPDSEQKARQMALDNCHRDSNGTPCRITEVVENTGTQPAPKSFGKLEARIAREEAQRNAAARR